jgi:hypothetical protein
VDATEGQRIAEWLQSTGLQAKIRSHACSPVAGSSATAREGTTIGGWMRDGRRRRWSKFFARLSLARKSAV